MFGGDRWKRRGRERLSNSENALERSSKVRSRPSVTPLSGSKQEGRRRVFMDVCVCVHKLVDPKSSKSVWIFVYEAVFLCVCLQYLLKARRDKCRATFFTYASISL